MFAKLATARTFDRPRQAARVFSPAYANDNRLRGRANSYPARRQTLACHWHIHPATGRLECIWHIEAAAAEDPLSDSTIVAVFVLAPRRAAWPRMQ